MIRIRALEIFSISSIQISFILSTIILVTLTVVEVQEHASAELRKRLKTLKDATQV